MGVLAALRGSVRRFRADPVWHFGTLTILVCIGVIAGVLFT